MQTRSTLTHLECSVTGTTHRADLPATLSPSSGRPLLARYDLDRAGLTMTKAALRLRSADLWRYEEVLPVRRGDAMVRLGEGWTPLVPARRLGGTIDVPDLWIKDEGLNPTGSFKARGLAMAISRAHELGVRELAIPSAGNAAGAAAAYAAAVGLPVHVFMPSDVPEVFVTECRLLGAVVTLVDGLIDDCGRRVAEGVAEHGWFDLSTLKEPYRVEGKKTMGYELFEQLGGRLPDAILYPTGGGTGLVGMWKAFDEMERLGWIGPERPRMFSVQATGCAPIVRAWEQGATHAEPWVDARTVAWGLRVPAAIGDFLILDAVRASDGAAVAVTDEAMEDAVRQIGRTTGVFAAPEGGAVAAAVPALLEAGRLDAGEEVVLFVTGSGLKYIT